MGDTFIPLIIALITSIILGPIFIPLLHKLKFGQNIRDDGPRSHLKKAGTPTMGGIIFFVATAVTIIFRRHGFTSKEMILFYSLLAFGFIGFLDDLLKIIHKNNLGLRAAQKMILLLLFSVAFAVYGYMYIGNVLFIPIFNISVPIGIWYIPFIVIYYAGVTNAVNLTDGLDGLATSVTIIVLTFFAIVAYRTKETEITAFCLALIGALIGFLRYNAFPAKIFMGDTGSLALGGAIATIALMLKLEILLVVVGGIYVMETLSVIIQVTSFKMTGKRVFKMAPIHHHFEQLGWSEVKIVAVFSSITAILCVIGFMII